MNKKEENKLVKERIEWFLNKKNLSENQLASLSGLSQSTLNGITNKQRIPNLTTLRKISKGLNITVQEFLNFSPYNEIEKNNVENDSSISITSEKMILEELKNLKIEIENLKKKKD